MVAPGLPVYCACDAGRGGELLPAVGTILRGSYPMRAAQWLLDRKESSGCMCRTIEERMTRNGPTWCRDNRETVMGWLRESAEAGGLPFSSVIVGLALDWAIRKALKPKRPTSNH